MSQEDKTNMKTIDLGKIPSSLKIAEDLTTAAADYVKVTTDRDCGLCTFLFFKKTPVPKANDRGMILDSMHDVGFLQIKVPIETAFALSEYMHGLLQEIRQNPNDRGYKFGPVSVES